jgi:hypothetical protein
MNYTTNQKGLITEMRVMLRLVEMGYDVSQPLNADSKYDCILDANGKLYKIQTKTAHKHPSTQNSIEIKCRSITTTQNHVKQKGYTSEDIDYFATFWENELYLIPVNECSSTKTLHLDKKVIRNNWSYLEDYKAQEVLNTL